MARHVFFSFHYQHDIWRVNQIRNLGEIVGCATAGFRDASLWEKQMHENQAAIRKRIDEGLYGTSVTVICIGAETAGRTFIDYEIEQSIARGNGLLGLRIHMLKNQYGKTDPPGPIPARLIEADVPIYDYTSHTKLKEYIEQAARRAGR
ncbi:TIR domain-containing protein [Azomonas macrocytogenes]|uniref:Thoeris protein ThsB TIR-like domain-containing protein n=1 Tax=Azomonas macrocytogenes TaxID=69962 RepID=A0A839T4Z5_AZOMA|nr:TIR domain-containing protein [Azomonas macrocytogenes]MBB3103840.1 hypothetical protein [Azomonas macrocytogenes]